MPRKLEAMIFVVEKDTYSWCSVRFVNSRTSETQLQGKRKGKAIVGRADTLRN